MTLPKNSFTEAATKALAGTHLNVSFSHESYANDTNAEVVARIRELDGVADVDHGGNGIDADYCGVTVKDPALFTQVRNEIEKIPGVERTSYPNDENNIRFETELLIRQIRELSPKARAVFDRLLEDENKVKPAPGLPYLGP